MEFWLSRGNKLHGTSVPGVWIISNRKGEHAVGIDNEWTGQIELASAEWHRTMDGAHEEVAELSIVNV